MSVRHAGLTAVLALAFAVAANPVLAQNNCKEVKGQEDGLFDPVTNTTSGTVTNANWLNGTYVAAFRPGAAPTQDPATVTFLGDYTLTTNQGVLKVFNVYLLNVVEGVAAVLGGIDPSTSTGIFAGATGVIYFATKVTSLEPFTVQEGLAGNVCFAH